MMKAKEIRSSFGPTGSVKHLRPGIQSVIDCPRLGGISLLVLA